MKIKKFKNFKYIVYVLLVVISILIFINNFIFYKKDSYTYTGKTLECSNEYSGDFKTRKDDWFIDFTILNSHEAKIILKYKGKERFLVEAISVLGATEEVSIDINNGSNSLLKIVSNDYKETDKTIEIKVDSKDNLYEIFNPKKVRNLNVNLTLKFNKSIFFPEDRDVEERYWGVISIAPINIFNFEYLEKRYIEGNKFFENKRGI